MEPESMPETAVPSFTPQQKKYHMLTFPNGNHMDLGMLETAIEDSDVAS
jgi:hypothetical protein